MLTKLRPPLPDISGTRAKNGAIVISDVKGYHQMDTYSCGASVTATLLAAVTDGLSADNWDTIARVSCPTREYGTPKDNVVKTLQKLRFHVTKMRGELNLDTIEKPLLAGDLILTSMRMPFSPAGTTHWVVVAGCSETEILVLNCTGIPLFTRRWIRWDDARAKRSQWDTLYRVDTGLWRQVADLRCNYLGFRAVRGCPWDR
jgi:hypothetical protein